MPRPKPKPPIEQSAVLVDCATPGDAVWRDPAEWLPEIRWLKIAGTLRAYAWFGSIGVELRPHDRFIYCRAERLLVISGEDGSSDWFEDYMPPAREGAK